MSSRWGCRAKAWIFADGWPCDSGLLGNLRVASVIGDGRQHEILDWTRRVVSNLMQWAMCVRQRLRGNHLQKRLDESVFR